MTGWGPDSIERWCTECTADAAVAALSENVDIQFALAGDAQTVRFTLRAGVLSPGANAPAFTLRAATADWQRFFTPTPAPPYHSWFGMRMRCAGARVDGDELAFAQHVHLVRRVLDVGRRLCGGTEGAAAVPTSKSAIRGGYVRISVAGEPCDVYYEQAGQGADLLFLHTAGSDGRQYHALMADDALASRCRMTTFDLPGHGRSDPLSAHLSGTYTLTTEDYATLTVAVADALGLRRPIVNGSSMAGEICLELAWRAPARFGGVIACEAADHVPGRRVGWARHSRVNQTLFVPEWVYGLSSPTSPRYWRDRIWWHYSQGGYGAFSGDIDFYSGDWDGRGRLARIDTGRCPVIMMTGEYDYSCTPEMSRATAETIPGAVYRTMPGLGHFPMAENPPLFATYLSSALDELGV